MRTQREWWQLTSSPRLAFVMAGLALLCGTLGVWFQPWWFVSWWLLWGSLYLASGLAMLRHGEPLRSKYPTRWFPFWPPDER